MIIIIIIVIIYMRILNYPSLPVLVFPSHTFIFLFFFLSANLSSCLGFLRQFILRFLFCLRLLFLSSLSSIASHSSLLSFSSPPVLFTSLFYYYLLTSLPCSFIYYLFFTL